MSIYKTIQGDTWDSIAYAQLGSEKHTHLLIEANLAYRDVYIFTDGVVLNIPNINTDMATVKLPPWKRVSG